MKKTLYIILALATLLIAATGCRRMSHNGDIDGFWRVVSVEETAAGPDGAPANVLYPEDTFFCINLELMQLRSPSAGGTGVMHFDKKGSRLTVEFPDMAQGTTPRALHIFGIWTNPVTFDYSADRRHLVLRTPEAVVKCDRF